MRGRGDEDACAKCRPADGRWQAPGSLGDGFGWCRPRRGAAILGGMVSARSLYAIGLFYAAYFAAMGVILPFFPVWLAGRGLDVAQVGLFTGLLSVAKVLAPPLAGRALDRARRVSGFIVAAGLAAAGLALAMPWADAPWMLALTVLAFGCLWAVVLPLTDGLSVAVSEAALAEYGRLRVWGSVGFVAASLAGGVWLADGRAAALPWWLAALLLVTALAALGFPERGARLETAGEPRTAYAASFAGLLVASFLMQASHGAYYGFYSLYLLDLGWDGWMVGSFWVLGVLAEIVLMWGWSRPVAAAAPARMLSLCLALAALRWTGIGLARSVWALALLQLLHAASFAAFHINAITWVRRYAPEARQVSAQGWYAAAGFGAGAALGVMACGQAVRAWGFSWAFLACAGVALAGIPVAMRLRAAP